MNSEIKNNKPDHPGTLTGWKHQNNRVYLYTNHIILIITLLNNDIIRFQYIPEDDLKEDFSYALDPDFKEKPPAFSIEQNKDSITIHTPTLHCIIDNTNLACRIDNEDGKTIFEDKKGFFREEHFAYGVNFVYNSKKIRPRESFYGLGDKPADLNIRGKKFVNHTTDPSGFDKDTDPIYKNIPFFAGLNDGLAYGIFFDNTYKSFFDFGHQIKNELIFGAYGGEMDYYFINGPSLQKVSENYAFLTGRPELPPLWALGYHQSKWSYYKEDVVKNIANELRKRRIPADVIYLDIDYMDGYRCFTWNKSAFPMPGKMIDALNQNGFKVVTIIDPGIKIDPDYWVYQEGLKKDVFCRRGDGALLKGSVWPGKCHFPDFTSPDVRNWWAGLYKNMLKEDGVNGIWNDMNEPVVFEDDTFPDDVRHDFEGHACSHRKAHNVYGMQMAHATYKGLKKINKNTRPFNITRSAYAGTQRYACVWTGDNKATWEHLHIANIQCQRLSISGISFCGSDTGGFFGAPDGELFARWVQMSIFHPFFRSHCAGDHGDKEPWVFGTKVEDIVRKFIELRYQLLPYIYTAFYQYVTRGTPMLRPVSFVDQDNKDTHSLSEEFMPGDHILTAPVAKKGVKTKKIYLPRGVWYNYWNDQYYKGKKSITIKAPLDTTPVMIRAGAVIPHYPVMQYTGEKNVDPLYLHIYHIAGTQKSELYEDAGEGYDYRHKQYTLRKFTVDGTKTTLEVTQTKEGKYQPSYGNYELILHGLPFKPVKCVVDGNKYDLKKETGDHTFRIWVPAGFYQLLVC